MSKRRAHYAPRIAHMFCEYIAEGKGVDEALREIGVLAPTRNILFRWMNEYPEFGMMYDRAVVMGADSHASEMLDIKNKVLDDEIKPAAGMAAFNILKWQCEVKNPSRYGPKAQLAAPKKNMTPQEIREEIAALQEQLGTNIQPGMVTAPRQPKLEAWVSPDKPQEPVKAAWELEDE